MPKFCSMWFLLVLLVVAHTLSLAKRWMQSYTFSAKTRVIYVLSFLSLSVSSSVFRNAFSCGNLSCWAWNCVCAFLHLSFINFSLHEEVHSGKFGKQQQRRQRHQQQQRKRRQKNDIKIVLIECDEIAKSEWSWNCKEHTRQCLVHFQMAYTNWQPSNDFLLKCLHVCAIDVVYILFGCQKIIYFVYGISWHWIYGRTIEPSGNSFSLCAHNTTKQLQRKCKPNQLLLFNIEQLRFSFSVNFSLYVKMCVPMNSNTSFNANDNQHQRHGK